MTYGEAILIIRKFTRFWDINDDTNEGEIISGIHKTVIKDFIALLNIYRPKEKYIKLTLESNNAEIELDDEINGVIRLEIEKNLIDEVNIDELGNYTQLKYTCWGNKILFNKEITDSDEQNDIYAYVSYKREIPDTTYTTDTVLELTTEEANILPIYSIWRGYEFAATATMNFDSGIDGEIITITEINPDRASIDEVIKLTKTYQQIFFNMLNIYKEEKYSLTQ